MKKQKLNCRLIDRFEDEGFSINAYEIIGISYVEIKYEKDSSIYLCSSVSEAIILMNILLKDYLEKKIIVEKIIELM